MFLQKWARVQKQNDIHIQASIVYLSRYWYDNMGITMTASNLGYAGSYL